MSPKKESFILTSIAMLWNVLAGLLVVAFDLASFGITLWIIFAAVALVDAVFVGFAYKKAGQASLESRFIS